MNKERRRFLRAPLSLTIKYHNPESIVIEEAFTGIMGGGGLFIETFHPLPVNDVITMELFLPGDVGKTVIKGMIVWNRREYEGDISLHISDDGSIDYLADELRNVVSMIPFRTSLSWQERHGVGAFY